MSTPRISLSTAPRTTDARAFPSALNSVDSALVWFWCVTLLVYGVSIAV